MTSDLKHFLDSTKKIREGLKLRAQFSQSRLVLTRASDPLNDCIRQSIEKAGQTETQTHQLSEPAEPYADQSAKVLPRLRRIVNLTSSVTHPGQLGTKPGKKRCPYAKTRVPQATAAKPKRWIFIKKAYLYPESRISRLLQTYKQALSTRGH